MSDTIGRITVPSLASLGQTLPLTSDVGFGFAQERLVVVHRFGELDAKAEQRFAVGLGPRKFAFMASISRSATATRSSRFKVRVHRPVPPARELEHRDPTVERPHRKLYHRWHAAVHCAVL